MNVEASKREDSGSIGLQREFTRDEVKECVAKLKNRKAAGADGIVNEFLKYGGEGMITKMVLFCCTTGSGKASTHPRDGEKE